MCARGRRQNREWTQRVERHTDQLSQCRPQSGGQHARETRDTDLFELSQRGQIEEGSAEGQTGARGPSEKRVGCGRCGRDGRRQWHWATHDESVGGHEAWCDSTKMCGERGRSWDRRRMKGWRQETERSGGAGTQPGRERGLEDRGEIQGD